MVSSAVTDAHWKTPPRDAQLRVEIHVNGGLSHDLDRIITAVLDALQNGGAIADDRQVQEISASRPYKWRKPPDVAVSVRVIESPHPKEDEWQAH